MQIKPFFPVFIVLVVTVIYAYYAMEKKPEKAMTATPKQYIQMVEEKKAERLKKRDTAAAEDAAASH
jgi:hypothetical protein